MDGRGEVGQGGDEPVAGVVEFDPDRLRAEFVVERADVRGQPVDVGAEGGDDDAHGRTHCPV